MQRRNSTQTRATNRSKTSTSVSQTINVTVMLIETIDQRLDAMIPQLNGAVVQRCENPRPRRMERQSFHLENRHQQQQ
jgi:hypothetical protein